MGFGSRIEILYEGVNVTMRLTDNKHNMILGVLLVVFGLTALVGNFVEIGAWGWVGILCVAGIFCFGIYWNERSNWAYLIPTYVLWATGGLVALVALNFLRGEAIASFVLTAIGLPFVIAFLRNRSLWGLLIPAYVLFAVGGMVGLIGLGWLKNLLIPAYVNFAIALPFFVVFFRNPANWWALIPGGVLGVVGLSFLLVTPAVRFIVPVILVGIGAWLILRQLNPRGKNEG